MNTRKLLIIVVILTLLSLASFFTIQFSNQILTHRLARPPQIARTKEVLMDRTNKGMQATMQLINEAYDSGFEYIFNSLAQSRAEEFQREGIAIFIFKDNELRFWSENMEIGHLKELSNKLVRVQNTWCISYWIARDNLKGLLLVKLRYNYPYQNQFLVNRYHSSLNFLEGYSVTPTSIDGSFPVALFGTTPTFYLSYIPKDFYKQNENFVSLLAKVGLVLLLVAVYLLFWIPFFRERPVLGIPLLMFSLVGVRYISLVWNLFPQGNWQLFGPEVFAYSTLIPSLGDLLLNTLIVFALACYTYRNLSKAEVTPTLLSRAVGVLFAALSILTLFLTDNLLYILVHNSTITLEAYRIFNMSIYTGLEYLSLSLWFVIAILLAHCSLFLLDGCRSSRFRLIWLLTFFAVLTMFWAFATLPSFYGIVLTVIAILLIQGFYKLPKVLNVNVYLVLILFFSVYSVILISNSSDQKDKEVRKILAINLANERDPVAEVIFPQVTRKMHADEEIVYLLDNIAENEVELYDYLKENYLNSYLKKYDFQITVCLTSSDIIIEKTGEYLRCYDFFEEMINDYGTRIPGTSFFHLNNQNGRVSYLGMIEYVLPDGADICIYLELDSKLSREVLGYPELLLDGSIKGRSLFSDYSSAKYTNNSLVASTGSFHYPLVNHFEIDSTQRYSFVDYADYNHLVYTNEGDVMLLLSRPKVNLFNITASFAWVFLFLYVMIVLWLILGGLPVAFNLRTPSLKNRIKFSVVQLIFLSLIMVGMVTIAYSVKSFEKKNYDNLNEKLLSAIADIEENLITHDLVHPDMNAYLTQYLVKLSNVLRSDINLYNQNGKLLATSRPEVFDRQLIGTEMHPLAWNELAMKHSPKLIHTEQIGEMEYLSAYAPLLNGSNQKVAYLNLPYFTRQGEFMLEIFSVVVALINIYALLILFAIFVAILISNQISKPLELIKEKLSKVDITKHNEPINYSGNDELGQLVKEYNRMVAELAESAMKIVQTQRQSAWREMAKQIAHEIKNPLTPIKLNLQHLIRAKQSNQPDWDKLFERFASSLIDQINTLSNIATEFSNFAKMPVGQFDHIVLNKVLDDSVNLFSAYPNVAVERDMDYETFTVYADKEQLARVFINLLKNAIQAIGKKQHGLVKVTLKRVPEGALVAIEDNGTGISPEVEAKMFSPNFTTKSGGMGLGLAISKGIIEAVGGKIWFETKFGEGTKFLVQLPLSQRVV